MAGRSTLTALQLGMEWFPEHGDGGLNRVFYHLTRALPASGVGCRGFVVGTDRVAADSGGRVVPFAAPTASLLSRWRRVRAAVGQALRDEPVDVVASHFALYTFPCLRLFSDRGLVVHFHGPWAAENEAEGRGGIANRARAAIEQAVYRRADRFIVLSAAFRDVLLRNYRIPEDRIRIVPGGVDWNAYALPVTRREARERLGWAADRPTVLAVRRLVNRMGLEDLISAAVRLREKVPDARVVIAGKGALREELEQQINALGLADHVQLLGFVPDDLLPVAYRAADLSVVPTTALEGFGLIAVESLAAGTPVLVTPVGGLPEVVRDLSPALVLPRTGADALADGLTAALRGDLPLPADDACRAFARDRYDWGRIAQQTRAVYDEVAG